MTARVAVFKRDRGVCQICRHPIDPSLRHPHPLSFVTDHRIPKDAGGGNGLANLQAAHAICNSKKGYSLSVGPPWSFYLHDHCASHQFDRHGHYIGCGNVLTPLEARPCFDGRYGPRPDDIPLPPDEHAWAEMAARELGAERRRAQ